MEPEIFQRYIILYYRERMDSEKHLLFLNFMAKKTAIDDQ